MLVLQDTFGSTCGFDHNVARLRHWRIVISFQLSTGLQIFLLGLCRVDSNGLFCIVIRSFVYDCSIAANSDPALACLLTRHNGNRAPIDLLEIAEVQERLLVEVVLRVALLGGVLVLVLILEIFDLDLHGGDLEVIGAIAAADLEVLERAVELALLSGRTVTFL